MVLKANMGDILLKIKMPWPNFLEKGMHCMGVVVQWTKDQKIGFDCSEL